MKKLTKPADWLRRVWQSETRAARYTLRGMVIGAVIGLLGFGLWSLRPSPQVWQVIGLSMLAISLLWLVIKGVPDYRRYRFLRKQRADLAAQRLEDKAEPRQALQARIVAAKKTLLHAPELERGANPLYRVPWFLLLGGTDASQQTLLEAAARASPFPPPAGEQPDYWRWWFFKNMAAIQTDQRFVCEVDDIEPRSVWYQALQLLTQHRDQLPLNGILVLVGAETLRDDPASLHDYGLKIRRLADEAMAFLRLQLPVYVVVTDCDRLAGFEHFVGRLPADVTRQALGHRLDNAPTAATPHPLFEAVFEPIRLRLHTIRLSLLKSPLDRQTRRGVFEFVEQFAALRAGLGELVTTLFEANPIQRTPQWRGLYFTGGAHQAAFVDDLFGRFLPNDQPLARRTQPAWLGHWVRSLFALALVAGLSWYLSSLVIDARREDRLLQLQAEHACPQEPSLLPAPERLAGLLECRQSIARLNAAVARRGPVFGLGHSARQARRLQARFVTGFRVLVLEPFDRQVTRDISRGRVAFDHYLAPAQRLDLLQACLDGEPNCGQENDVDNLIFGPGLTRSLALVQNAAAGVVPGLVHGQDVGDGLLRGYLAYLRWQPDARRTLRAEHDRQRRLLEQLLEMRPPTPDDVLRWAAARPSRYPPYARAQLWQRRPASPDDVQVAAAFTRAVWSGVVSPFLEHSVRFAPAAAVAVAGFGQAYGDAYFTAWRDFLAAFPGGYALWRDEPEALAEFLTHGDSAYPQLWRILADQVFAESLPQASKPPAWREALRRSLQQDRERIEPPTDRLLALLRQDHSGRLSYDLISELYSPTGGPSAVAGQREFWELWQVVERATGQPGTALPPEDHAAWAVLQGPVRLLLQLLTHRAGVFLQAQWQKTVAEPVKTLAAEKRLQALRGRDGKLRYFTDVWLKPFVSADGWAPKTLAGLQTVFPLSDRFQEFAHAVASAGDSLWSGKPFYAGRVRFTRPAECAGINVAGTETRFEMHCGERSYGAAIGAGGDAASADVFWSPRCSSVRLAVSVAGRSSLPQSPARPARVVLSKRYSGPDAFVQLANDFSTGERRFTRDNLMDNYETAEKSRVQAQLIGLGVSSVRIFLRVELSAEMRDYLDGPRGIDVPDRIVAPFA